MKREHLEVALLELPLADPGVPWACADFEHQGFGDHPRTR